jgi:hypothetical protein
MALAAMTAAIGAAEALVAAPGGFRADVIVPALIEAERYAAANRGQVFLSGAAATRSPGDEIGDADYSLEFHAPTPNVHARALADKIQKRLAPKAEQSPPLDRVVQVQTQIFNVKIAIIINRQHIVTFHLLPRAAAGGGTTRIADAIRAERIPGQWDSSVTMLAFGPELLLAQVYGVLCDPTAAANWASFSANERRLRARLLQRAWGRSKRGGADDPKVPLSEKPAREPEPCFGGTTDGPDLAGWGSIEPADIAALDREEGISASKEPGTFPVSGGAAAKPEISPAVAARLVRLILLEYAGPSRILVGEHAVDWRREPRRIQFVANESLGAEEETLRRLLIPGLSAGYELSAHQHDLFLPSDPRLRRLTLTLVRRDTGQRRALVDVFNLPQYTLCPFFMAPHPGAAKRTGGEVALPIGTLPLVLRLLVAELWYLRVLSRIGRLPPGRLDADISDVLESIRVAGKKLDLRLLGRGKERAPEFSHVFPPTAEWYAGRVVDEALMSKRAQLKAGAIRRAPPYYPLRTKHRAKDG